MEDLVRQYAVPVTLALVVGYLGRYIEPRSKLVHWFAAALRFKVPFTPAGGNAPQIATIWTHALSVQNLGWRAVRDVEIIHRYRPQHFQLQPALHFTEATNPTGEHIIRIPSLARREYTTIQIISHGNQPPDLTGIKSGDGPSTYVTTRQQFVISRARRLVFLALIVIGFVTVAYWALQITARVLPALLGMLTA